jgi:two-component system, OmpR family, sensor histidine kinase KdpD
MHFGGERPTPTELLKELGGEARLTVYLGFAPGVGKTYRLINEARQMQRAGVRVMLGWIELKGRADLERFSEGIPRLPPRMVTIGTSTFPEFDYEAALTAHPQAIVLDELAHANLPGSVHAKRWQDALALRDAGISVLGALNISHLETVAPTAEALIGFPIREIVPLSFLKAADQVIAIDIAPEQLEARLHAGAIMRKEDVERALQGPFRPQTLRALREMMLRTVDLLTEPMLPPARISKAVALLVPGIEPEPFLERAAAFADAFNLAFGVQAGPGVDETATARSAQAVGAQVLTSSGFDFERPRLADVNASFVAAPTGGIASAFVRSPIDRDLLVVGPAVQQLDRGGGVDFGQHPYARTARDRMRVGYGRLTVFLGAAAGCGKTYAMLEQAQQLKADGVDVVVAFVETHGRADTAKKLEGLEALPRLEINSGGVRYSELDFERVLARRPAVALIDELAHTNAPGSKFAKRYEDVLSVLRSGISVLTTLNVQHLEGLNDVVRRLTGVTVRETMPDGILELADDVVLIDASAQTLRDRLREGKIYPKERIEAALGSFFRTENLTALRELALREALRTREGKRKTRAVSAIVLGVAARERDTGLIQRAGRLARRLDADFSVVHVAASQQAAQSSVLDTLRETARTADGQWFVEIDVKPARGLARAGAARPASTIVIEGVRSSPAWWGPKTFAQQVLENGAQELLVLAPVL